jgi:hypothetical protein
MEIPSSNESEMKFDRKKRKGGRLIRKREMVRESIVNWERERNETLSKLKVIPISGGSSK